MTLPALEPRVRRSMPVAEAPAPVIRGAGIVTGWGEGLSALGAAVPDGARGLVAVPTPALAGERFRRATRECLLGVAAVRAAARDAGLDPAALAGARTGVLYASATGYASANRAFLEDESSTTLHFPYTAPSAVPGEVTIAFEIRGPYVNLMGGGPAALQALWLAARWLADGAADRVLVLAVEAVHEVWDLFARARRLHARPLIESAACLLLESGRGEALAWASAAASRREAARGVTTVIEAVLGDRRPRTLAGCAPGRGPGRFEASVLAARGVEATRVGVGSLGEAFACGPLIGLAQARESGLGGLCLVTAAWRNDYAAMLWPL